MIPHRSLALLLCAMLPWTAASSPPLDPSSPFVFLDPFREIFDHVYVIAVESRRSRVTALLESLNFHSPLSTSSSPASSFATIVPAVLKPTTEADWGRVRTAGDFDLETLGMMTAGEIAISLSQRKVLRQFIKGGRNKISNEGDKIGSNEWRQTRAKTKNTNLLDDTDVAGRDAVALIFEDDFAENGFGIRERLERSAHYLVTGTWDILFLGRCHDTCDSDVLLGGDLYRVFAPACLHAYAVTKRGARIILEAASGCKGPSCPIDNVVRTAISTGRLRATAVSPQLFTQDRSFRGQGSLVGADSADLDRMLSTGDHLKHALRRGENVKNRNNNRGLPPPLPECKKFHERLLISNVNAFADKHAIRPRPGSLGERMSAHNSHGEQHRPWEERWFRLGSPERKENADGDKVVADRAPGVISAMKHLSKYIVSAVIVAILYKCWRKGYHCNLKDLKAIRSKVF